MEVLFGLVEKVREHWTEKVVFIWREQRMQVNSWCSLTPSSIWVRQVGHSAWRATQLIHLTSLSCHFAQLSGVPPVCLRSLLPFCLISWSRVKKCLDFMWNNEGGGFRKFIVKWVSVSAFRYWKMVYSMLFCQGLNTAIFSFRGYWLSALVVVKISGPIVNHTRKSLWN